MKIQTTSSNMKVIIKKTNETKDAIFTSNGIVTLPNYTFYGYSEVIIIV